MEKLVSMFYFSSVTCSCSLPSGARPSGQAFSSSAFASPLKALASQTFPSFETSCTMKSEIRRLMRPPMPGVFVTKMVCMSFLPCFVAGALVAQQGRDSAKALVELVAFGGVGGHHPHFHPLGLRLLEQII